ncbi:MATE family efflux transporter [Oscillospiraceae bacterium OttesenSCG-928-F05]|nr:MATE family efflux transporter [Oscillospiraceae bacterium OttesenSCG-928-F05]
MSETLLSEREKARHIMMTEQPVQRLIVRLAVPTIVSMLISAFYNMADTFFVAKLGTEATAAVGVNFSLMSYIQAIGLMFGTGASSNISRLLGAKKEEEANRTAATAFFSSVSAGVLICVLGLLFISPLMRLLGATETVLPYSVSYASYILFAAPFMAGSFVMNHTLRAEGSAMYSMIGMLSGAVLNLALDPLLIFVFDMGIAGAAIATAISQVVSFGILLSHFLRGKSLLRLRIRNWTFTGQTYWRIFRMGFPTLLRNGLMSTATAVMNNVAGGFGDAPLAAMAVTNRLMMFITSSLIGFGQGFQPVAGFNWGAKLYGRARKAYGFVTVVGVVGMAVLCGALALAAEPVMRLFSDDGEIISLGVLALRSQCLLHPLIAVSIMVSMAYQAFGWAAGAALLSLARQGLCLIPAVFIMPALMGVTGVALTQAAADVLAILITIPFAARSFYVLRQRMNETELAPPAQEEPAL